MHTALLPWAQDAQILHRQHPRQLDKCGVRCSRAASYLGKWSGGDLAAQHPEQHAVPARREAVDGGRAQPRGEHAAGGARYFFSPPPGISM